MKNKINNNFFYNKIKFYLFGEKFSKKLNYDWNLYPKKLNIIQEIINKKNFKDYLEIGCDNNETFSNIKISNKVGVDPISGGTLRMTSDNFFKNNETFFDLIFLDGSHTFQQTFRDIENSINFLKDDGIILVHDCLPTEIKRQVVPRICWIWNGDVWKAIVKARTKKNIQTYTCMADHGLGIIIKKENLNPLSLEIENLNNLKFKDYFNNHKKFMNLISYKELEAILIK